MVVIIEQLKLMDMQRFLKDRWQEWARERGQPDAATGVGMCRFSSFFLEKVLGGSWRVAGGEQHYDWSAQRHTGTGGFFDGDAWRAHYWISDGKVILDLAAGQFGADEILVANASDSRYAANYLPHELKEHRVHVAQRVRSWVTMYKTQIPLSR
jgi:hypothetical protein